MKTWLALTLSLSLTLSVFVFVVTAEQDDILINEIMYDLSGADEKREWIELYNQTDRELDLTNWKINDGDDLTNHKLNIPPINGGQGSMKIAPLGFVILASDAPTFLQEHQGFEGTVIDTVLALNNTTATIKLLDPSSSVVSQTTYNKDMGANGNNRTLERQEDGSYKESSGIGGTPNAENSQGNSGEDGVTSDSGGEETVDLISIKDARQKEKDDEVLVEGLVSVNSGSFSSHYIYVQDSTAGIQIYFSKDLPNLNIGKKIRVQGVLSEAYNEKRIKISQSSNISNLGQEQEPAPTVIKTGQINENFEGMLIRVKGKVVDPSGSTFYLDDGSGKIKIYIKKETKIEKPRLSAGQALEVTGIVSQYKNDYRILPRINGDLKTQSGQTLAGTTTKKKKKKAGSSNGNESDTEKELVESNGVGRVLGAFAEKSKQNWWLILLGLGVLGGGGYLGYDFYLQKRTGNSKIWSKAGPKIARLRNYWAFRRPGRW